MLAERRGNVMVITINRPEARNAVNGAVSIGVGDALEEAQHDPEVRAVVITGAGDKSFCAGADLKAISRRENLYHPDHAEWGFAGYVHHFIDKPTIAAVNGTALGGGTELALASDLVVAARARPIRAAGGQTRTDRRRRRRFPDRGAAAPQGGDGTAADRRADHRLRRVGMGPDQPGRQGGPGRVLDAALALAARVTVNAPLSVQASKRIAYGVDEGVITADEAGWERTMNEMRSLIRSEDAKEGPLAFAEKREPIWKAR